MCKKVKNISNIMFAIRKSCFVKKMRIVSRNIAKDYDVEFSYPSNLSNKWTAFQHVIGKNPYKSFLNKNEAKKFLLPPTLTHLFSHTSIYIVSVLEM